MYIRRTRRRTGRRTRRDVSCSVRQGLQRDVTTLLTFCEHVLDSLPRLPSPPSEPPWKQPPPGRPPPWKGRYAAAPAPAPALSVGITSVDSHCLCVSRILVTLTPAILVPVLAIVFLVLLFWHLPFLPLSASRPSRFCPFSGLPLFWLCPFSPCPVCREISPLQFRFVLLMALLRFCSH